MVEHILAVDLGTSGMKTLLLSEDGVILAQASAGYNTRYESGGRAEQNADDWWQALLVCCRDISTQAESGENPGLSGVAAIGISGHMMAGLGIDQDGQPVGPALIHADTRATAEVEAASRALGAERIYALTGHRPSPAYSAPKMAWLRQHEPERYRTIACFLNPKDYLNFRLSGILATEWTDASGTLLFNLHQRNWDTELLDAFQVDAGKLPQVLPSCEVLGRVSAEAAALTGLPASAAVVAGSGDGICAGVGAASVEPGITYNYIGSTAWVASSCREPVADPDMRVITFAHAVPGLYHALGVMQTAGATVDWFRRQYLQHIADDATAYTELDRLVAASVPGSRGLIFLPYLMGERSPWWNPQCRASWHGLSMQHGLADLTRSLFEGVSHHLSLIADILDRYSPFDELSLLGGGGQSDHWPQILCDSFGKPLSLHRDSASITARGAAVIAGVGIGMYPDLGAARNFITVEKHLQPDSQRHAIMADGRNRLSDLYRTLYGTTKGSAL